MTSTPEDLLEVSFPGSVHPTGVSLDEIEMADPEPEPTAEPDHLDADREWTITQSAFDDRLTVEATGDQENVVCVDAPSPEWAVLGGADAKGRSSRAAPRTFRSRRTRGASGSPVSTTVADASMSVESPC